ncbi:hypothetical protein JYU34_001335 [Plutella xylostella]|uniref:C2H2-type domain-containing protein n=1 Tax=Plutella xylostella TaxID=51655 RepID=A0ABQ7R6L9_PLUXY|nr:hypothetical protein JYU34_001335 [Plutella xylostella]
MSSDIDIEEPDLQSLSAARLQSLVTVKTELLDEEETPFEYEYEESQLQPLYDEEVPDSTTDPPPPRAPAPAPAPSASPPRAAPAPSPRVSSTREDDQPFNNCIILGSKPTPLDETFSKVKIDCHSLQQNCVVEDQILTPEEEYPTENDEYRSVEEEYETVEEECVSDADSAPSVDVAHCTRARVVLADWAGYLRACGGYCAPCRVLFPTRNALDAHKMAAHSYLVAVARSPELEPAPVVKKDCFVCKKQFSNEKDLIKHIYLHVSTSQACHLCEETFYSKQLLEEHVATAHPAPPAPPAAPGALLVHSCPVCHHYYRSLPRLLAHALRRHRLRPPAPPAAPATRRCPVCAATLATFKSYNSHIAVVHKQLYDRVVGDEVKLKQKSQGKIPRWRPRNDVRTLLAKDALFYCATCGLSTPDLVSHERHVRACARRQVPSYQCAECGARVPRRFRGFHRRQHGRGAALPRVAWGAPRALLRCPLCAVHHPLAGFRAHVRGCAPPAPAPAPPAPPPARCPRCPASLPPGLAAEHAALHAAAPSEPFTIITILGKTKSSSNKSAEAVDEAGAAVPPELQLEVCGTCGCAMAARRPRPHHLRGACRGIQAWRCRHCALRVSKNAMTRHLKLHRLLPRFTLANFRFRWLGAEGPFRTHAAFFHPDAAPGPEPPAGRPGYTVVPLDTPLVYQCRWCGACIPHRSTMARHLQPGPERGARCRGPLPAPAPAPRGRRIEVASLAQLRGVVQVLQCAACRFHCTSRAALRGHGARCPGGAPAPPCARCSLPVRAADAAWHRALHACHPDLRAARLLVRPARPAPPPHDQPPPGEPEPMDDVLIDEGVPVPKKVTVDRSVVQIKCEPDLEVPLKQHVFYQCSSCRMVLHRRHSVYIHAARCSGRAAAAARCPRCSVPLRPAQRPPHRRLHQEHHIDRNNISIVPFSPGIKPVQLAAADASQPGEGGPVLVYECVQCGNILHLASNIPRHRAQCRGVPRAPAACPRCPLRLPPTCLRKHLLMHDQCPDMRAGNIQVVKFSSKKNNLVFLGSKLPQPKNRIVLGSKLSQTKTENKVVLGSKICQSNKLIVGSKMSRSAKFKFYQCRRCSLVVRDRAKHRDRGRCKRTSRPLITCTKCLIPLRRKQVMYHERLHRQKPSLNAETCQLIPFVCEEAGAKDEAKDEDTDEEAETREDTDEEAAGPSAAEESPAVPLHRCPACRLHFLSAAEGAQHAAAHRAPRPARAPRAPCAACRLHFPPRLLPAHARLHHASDQPANYDILDIELDEEPAELEATTSRKRRHDGEPAAAETVYRCGGCGLSHVCRASAERHRAACGGAAGGAGGLACSKCELQFDMQQLLQHSLKHHGERAPPVRVVTLAGAAGGRRVYHCEQCGFNFMRPGSLAWHRRPHHRITERRRCRHCRLLFSKPSISKHELLHHTRNNYSLEDLDIVDEYNVKIPLEKVLLSLTDKDSEEMDSEIGQDNKLIVGSKVSQSIEKSEKVKESADAREPTAASFKFYQCRRCRLVVRNTARHLGDRCKRTSRPLITCTKCPIPLRRKQVASHKRLHRQMPTLNADTCQLIPFGKTGEGTRPESQTDDDDDAATADDDDAATADDEDADLEVTQNADDTAEEGKTEANLPDVVTTAGGEATDANKGEATPRDGLEYYRCRECNVAFLEQGKCELHVHDHTPMEEYDFVECKICKMNFELEALKTHMTHHKNQLFSVDSVKWVEYFSNGDRLEAASGNENELNSSMTSVNDDEMEVDEILGT